MNTITAAELARRLADVLNRVRRDGERFLVQHGGEAIAVIEPVTPRRGVTLGEFLKMIRALPRPDEGFWDDLDRTSAEQPRAANEFPE